MDECEEYKEFYKEILNDQVEASKIVMKKSLFTFSHLDLKLGLISHGKLKLARILVKYS